MCIQDAIANGIFMHILILHTLFKNIPLELFSDRLTDGNYFFQKKITCSLLLPSPLLCSENQMALPLGGPIVGPSECTFLRR